MTSQSNSSLGLCNYSDSDSEDDYIQSSAKPSSYSSRLATKSTQKSKLDTPVSILKKRSINNKLSIDTRGAHNIPQSPHTHLNKSRAQKDKGKDTPVGAFNTLHQSSGHEKRLPVDIEITTKLKSSRDQFVPEAPMKRTEKSNSNGTASSISKDIEMDEEKLEDSANEVMNTFLQDVNSIALGPDANNSETFHHQHQSISGKYNLQHKSQKAICGPDLAQNMSAIMSKEVNQVALISDASEAKNYSSLSAAQRLSTDVPPTDSTESQNCISDMQNTSSENEKMSTSDFAHDKAMQTESSLLESQVFTSFELDLDKLKNSRGYCPVSQLASIPLDSEHAWMEMLVHQLKIRDSLLDEVAGKADTLKQKGAGLEMDVDYLQLKITCLESEVKKLKKKKKKMVFNSCQTEGLVCTSEEWQWKYWQQQASAEQTNPRPLPCSEGVDSNSVDDNTQITPKISSQESELSSPKTLVKDIHQHEDSMPEVVRNVVEDNPRDELQSDEHPISNSEHGNSGVNEIDMSTANEGETSPHCDNVTKTTISNAFVKEQSTATSETIPVAVNVTHENSCSDIDSIPMSSNMLNKHNDSSIQCGTVVKIKEEKLSPRSSSPSTGTAQINLGMPISELPLPAQPPPAAVSSSERQSTSFSLPTDVLPLQPPPLPMFLLPSCAPPIAQSLEPSSLINDSSETPPVSSVISTETSSDSVTETLPTYGIAPSNANSLGAEIMKLRKRIDSTSSTDSIVSIEQPPREEKVIETVTIVEGLSETSKKNEQSLEETLRIKKIALLRIHEMEEVKNAAKQKEKEDRVRRLKEADKAKEKAHSRSRRSRDRDNHHRSNSRYADRTSRSDSRDRHKRRQRSRSRSPNRISRRSRSPRDSERYRDKRRSRSPHRDKRKSKDPTQSPPHKRFRVRDKKQSLSPIRERSKSRDKSVLTKTRHESRSISPKAKKKSKKSRRSKSLGCDRKKFKSKSHSPSVQKNICSSISPKRRGKTSKKRHSSASSTSSESSVRKTTKKKSKKKKSKKKIAASSKKKKKTSKQKDDSEGEIPERKKSKKKKRSISDNDNEKDLPKNKPKLSSKSSSIEEKSSSSEDKEILRKNDMSDHEIDNVDVTDSMNDTSKKNETIELNETKNYEEVKKVTDASVNFPSKTSQPSEEDTPISDNRNSRDSSPCATATNDKQSPVPGSEGDAPNSCQDTVDDATQVADDAVQDQRETEAAGTAPSDTSVSRHTGEQSSPPVVAPVEHRSSPPVVDLSDSSDSDNSRSSSSSDEDSDNELQISGYVQVSSQPATDNEQAPTTESPAAVPPIASASTAPTDATNSGFVFSEELQLYYDQESGYYYDSTTAVYYDSSNSTYCYYDTDKQQYNYTEVLDASRQPPFTLLMQYLSGNTNTTAATTPLNAVAQLQQAVTATAITSDLARPLQPQTITLPAHQTNGGDAVTATAELHADLQNVGESIPGILDDPGVTIVAKPQLLSSKSDLQKNTDENSIVRVRTLRSIRARMRDPNFKYEKPVKDSTNTNNALSQTAKAAATKSTPIDAIQLKRDKSKRKSPAKTVEEKKKAKRKSSTNLEEGECSSEESNSEGIKLAAGTATLTYEEQLRQRITDRLQQKKESSFIDEHRNPSPNQSNSSSSDNDSSNSSVSGNKSDCEDKDIDEELWKQQYDQHLQRKDMMSGGSDDIAPSLRLMVVGMGESIPHPAPLPSNPLTPPLPPPTIAAPLPRKLARLHVVTKDGANLGRLSKNGVHLPHISVSKDHACIEYTSAGRGDHHYHVRDLGSNNGTYVNGTRLSASKMTSLPVELGHGWLLVVGEVHLQVHLHPNALTCNTCEPGLLPELAPLTQASIEPSVSSEASRRSTQNSLRRKYGLQNPSDNSCSSTVPVPSGTSYGDRSDVRRVTKGSDNPYEKTHVASVHESLSSNNKGFKLLQKMGWAEGSGLGKTILGRVEPVLSEARMEGAGLGAAAGPAVGHKSEAQTRTRAQMARYNRH